MAWPQFNRYGLYGDPIQLICRGKLSRPTFQALLISLNNLKRDQLFRYQLSERIIIRKTNIFVSIPPQVCPRIISTYHIPFLVTKFLITLYIQLSNFFFLYPFLEESIFLIQLLGLHLSPPLRQPLIFTWMLVPSEPCWRWQNRLQDVRALFKDYSTINVAS